MSAIFKNSKKKVSQMELRKFMNEHKTKQKAIKKIISPLAKYNDQDQLTCVLCKSIVRSEAVWTVHVNAKVHKQNVEIAKELKEKTNNFTTLKRRLTPPLIDASEKKIKSILKNSNNVDQDENKTNYIKNDHLPDNFFDANEIKKNNTPDNKRPFHKKHEMMETEDISENKDVLPEGFFDDPKLDAKARNQEYKNPIEEEWEKFVKAIKEADSESSAIIAEDQEEATIERQIVEIDEQMKKLSRIVTRMRTSGKTRMADCKSARSAGCGSKATRQPRTRDVYFFKHKLKMLTLPDNGYTRLVLDLEKKKVQIISTSSDFKNLNTNEDFEEESDNNFDEFLDWRAKKSFK